MPHSTLVIYRTFTIGEDTEVLSKIDKALSHPTRIAILKHLKNQSCCFTGDLVDIRPISHSAVSQHLKKI